MLNLYYLILFIPLQSFKQPLKEVNFSLDLHEIDGPVYVPEMNGPVYVPEIVEQKPEEKQEKSKRFLFFKKKKSKVRYCKCYHIYSDIKYKYLEASLVSCSTMHPFICIQHCQSIKAGAMTYQA